MTHTSFGALAASLLMLASAACSNEVEQAGTNDGGGGGSSATGGSDNTGNSGTGASSGACDAPDTSCPSTMPFAGGPCEGNLSCDYEGELFHFECDAGEWAGGIDCEQIVGGSCTPPPSESCDGPFEGEMVADVMMGPDEDGALRAFEPGELVDIEWGGQGSAMVFYRLEIDGDDVPSCVVVTTTVAPVGITPETSKRVTRLRCGNSLSMYLTIPYGTCMETEPVDTTVTIDVEGIGTTEATIAVPAEAFCGGFG